jgi:hypothetical protein
VQTLVGFIKSEPKHHPLTTSTCIHSSPCRTSINPHLTHYIMSDNLLENSFEWLSQLDAEARSLDVENLLAFNSAFDSSTGLEVPVNNNCGDLPFNSIPIVTSANTTSWNDPTLAQIAGQQFYGNAIPAQQLDPSGQFNNMRQPETMQYNHMQYDTMQFDPSQQFNNVQQQGHFQSLAHSQGSAPSQAFGLVQQCA